MVIDKAIRVPPNDEDDETSNNDLEVSEMIASSGIGDPNRGLDVRTEWAMFTALEFYKDDDGGELNVMLCQGPCFDRSALEEGSIAELYACDGWLPGGIRLEWTTYWCWRIQFVCNECALIIHSGLPRQKACAFARQVHNSLTRIGPRVSMTSFDMICFRTHGEMDCLDVIKGIPSSTIVEWSGMEFVARDASVR